MSEYARHTLGKLLEQHGSWAVVALVLGERVDTLVSVFGGGDASVALVRKLEQAGVNLPVTPRSVRRP